MIKYFRLSFFALIALFISCSDSPTSVGENIIPDQDKINFAKYDSFTEDTPQKSFYYKQKLKLGTSAGTMLGKNSYAEYSIMYKFWIAFDDSVLTKIYNNQIVINWAKMRMIKTYSLGEKNANFDFTVHQVRKAWTEEGFDEDTLAVLPYDRADVSFSRTVTDSLVSFNLKPQVITDWLKVRKDTNLARNYGLLLKPTSGTSRVAGFDAVFTDGNSKNIAITFEIQRLAGNKKDTFTVAPFWDVHTSVGKHPVSANHLFVQGSLGMRSVLSFDLAKIPKNIILNKAILDLTVDPSLTIDGVPASDSLSVQLLGDSTSKKLTGDSLYFAYLTRKNDVYSGDIAWIVQKWINGEANQGIKIRLPDEEYSASRIALFNSRQTNKALRPRLTLTYTIK
ncbi:MAG: DNRLRE domain-containing protein [Bacteroidota bacterium]